jgi:hypothetical protein
MCKYPATVGDLTAVSEYNLCASIRLLLET